MNKVKNFFQSYMFVFLFAALLLFLRLFVFSSVVVVGHSMDPSLVNGERIIAMKHAKVKRFDIVTFPAPGDPKRSYIKRVIGLPGDTIEFKDDQLFVNGKEVREPYLDQFKSTLPAGENLTEDFSLSELGVDKVPANKFFVLGDNRQNSKDSRMIGFIDKKNITGDVSFVLWPLNRFGFLPSVEEQ